MVRARSWGGAEAVGGGTVGCGTTMDRLGQLRGTGGGDVEVEMTESKEDDVLRSFEVLGRHLKQIRGNTDRIKELRQKAEMQVRDADEKQIMEELDRLILDTKACAVQSKDMITALEAENKKYEKEHPHSTTAQIRNNMLATHTTRFNEDLKEYQHASETFRDSLRSRIGRQARILKKDITDDQVEEIINSNNPGLFLKEAMGLSDVLVDAVAVLEERHERIHRIEQGVREVYDLFQDLATLVDVQQEYLNNIEQNVTKTQNYVEKGETALLSAERYNMKSRKCACYLMIVVVVILLIVLLAGGIPGFSL